jgi:hypothetical protein
MAHKTLAHSSSSAPSRRRAFGSGWYTAVLEIPVLAPALCGPASKLFPPSPAPSSTPQKLTTWTCFNGERALPDYAQVGGWGHEWGLASLPRGSRRVIAPCPLQGLLFVPAMRLPLGSEAHSIARPASFPYLF